MSQANMNGRPVLAAELTMPRRGAWSGYVELDGEAIAEGTSVQIGFAGAPFSFVGTVRESGPWQGRARHFVVAGGGGLGTSLESRYYYASPARLPIGDVVREAGEALSPTIAVGTLDALLPAWTRAAGDAGAELDALVRALGLSWRTLADGTIWIGTETWPLGPDVAEQLADGSSGELVVATDYPSVLPGQSLPQGRTSTVTHLFGDKLRTRIVLEPSDEQLEGRELGWFRKAVRAQVPELRFLMEYRATVVTDNGDGTLDVDCDAPIGGLSRVPVRLGLPGCSVEVAKGARVQVAFAGASRMGAYVSLWDTEAEAVTITIDAGTIRLGAAEGAAIREGETVKIQPPGAPPPPPVIGTITVELGLGVPPTGSRVLA